VQRGLLGREKGSSHKLIAGKNRGLKRRTFFPKVCVGEDLFERGTLGKSHSGRGKYVVQHEGDLRTM